MTRAFRTFLLHYCQDLSGLQTTSIKKLFKAAEKDRPRLREPLALLAACDKRENYLLKASEGTAAGDAYSRFFDQLHASNQPLEEYLATLPEGDRYGRVLSAWKAESARRATDQDLLKNVAAAILELLSERSVSRAEACRIAHLNKGNFYAFLKGDPSKLSRQTALRAYDAIADACRAR